MKPFEEYLMILGEYHIEYSYDTKLLYEHLDYFRKCWEDNLSVYKSLELFWYHLNRKV